MTKLLNHEEKNDLSMKNSVNNSKAFDDLASISLLNNKQHDQLKKYYLDLIQDNEEFIKKNINDKGRAAIVIQKCFRKIVKIRQR